MRTDVQHVQERLAQLASEFDHLVPRPREESAFSREQILEKTLSLLVHDVLDQQEPVTREGAPISRESVFIQMLVALVEILPSELHPDVRRLTDTARLSQPYRSYILREGDLVLVGEKIVALYEHQAAALRGLQHVEACGVSARMAQIRVTFSPLPAGYPMRQVDEEVRWAVLVSAEVNRAALLARLYPGLSPARPSSASSTTTAASNEYAPQ